MQHTFHATMSWLFLKLAFLEKKIKKNKYIFLLN